MRANGFQGDVSLEEMILHTTFLHSERRDVAKNVADVVSTVLQKYMADD